MNDTVYMLIFLLCGAGFVVLFFGGGGGYLLYVSLSAKKKAQASQNWPTTQGRVASSEIKRVVHHDSHGTHTSLQLAIQYDYTVDGIPYVGDKYTIGPIAKGINPSKVQETLDRYPAGATVTVYYNPKNPQEACLERVAPLSNLTLIIGIVLLAIMLCSFCPLAFILYSMIMSM